MSSWFEVLRLLGFLVGIIAFVAFNAAYLVWLERKEAGHIQRRIGPKEVGPYGLLQPVADGVKLMAKQLIIPDGADKLLFMMAPVLVMTPALMVYVTIPYTAVLVPRSMDLGLLAIFAFGSVNVLGLLLGAWGSRNKYAIISSARVVSQNVAYEIPMLVVVVTLVMVTGTMNLTDMVAAQDGGFWNWNIFRLSASPLMPVAFLIYFVCMLAETNRAPFDMTEAESELIAGAFTEYPGMGFGVFFMGEYSNVLAGSSLATVLFLGGWNCPFGLFPGLHWFLIKLYLIIFTVIWIRWTFPRTTFYGLLNLSWKILIPISFANLILTSALLKVF
ncbi:NADH-quinone oxidoreductase subunit NuoH [Fundidesulfovibrio butyratiphilus]